MEKVAGLQFLFGLKVYDFKIGETNPKLGDMALVETVQGKDVGKVVYIGKEVDEKKLESPLKEIIRILSKEESEEIDQSRKKNKEGDLEKFQQVIDKHSLMMRPIFVDRSIFEDRIDLYFSSDGRVDFRNAIRDLSRAFSLQVRLRQVGSRDEARILGGFGPCGREICCLKFYLGDAFSNREKVGQAVKNTNKTLGLCGKVMCCLNFEDNTMPKGEKK